MNIYTTSFIAACPNDGLLIAYQLEIKSGETIMCEDINEILTKYAGQAMYQEDIADDLFSAIPCHQLVLKGQHAGIDVTSTRP